MDLSPFAMRAFASVLKTRTGQELAVSRQWRIETALKPLMRDRAFPSLDSLAASLSDPQDAQLVDDVVEALLNHETFFYREHAAFRQLMEDGIEDLAAARANTRRLRIWCVGCSTGQEVYSLAMNFAEAAGRWQGWTIEIFGSDVSAGVVKRAAGGRYNQFEIQRGLPVRQMMRWFSPDGDEWCAVPQLRHMVRFEEHNILDPSPLAAGADVILCRNVLLYFGAEERARAFERLAAAIAPDGLLMMGAGETVLGNTALFEPSRKHRGFYGRTG